MTTFPEAAIFHRLLIIFCVFSVWTNPPALSRTLWTTCISGLHFSSCSFCHSFTYTWWYLTAKSSENSPHIEDSPFMSHYIFTQIPHFSQHYLLAHFFMDVEFLLCGNPVFLCLGTFDMYFFIFFSAMQRTTQMAAASLTLIFQRQQQLITR